MTDPLSEIQLVCDQPTNEPTDGRTDGRMDRQTDQWTDGPTDGRIYPLIEMRERIKKETRMIVAEERAEDGEEQGG